MHDAIAKASASSFEQHIQPDRLAAGVLHGDRAVRRHAGGDGHREARETSIEEEFLVLRADLYGRRVGLAGGVVMALPFVDGEGATPARRDPVLMLSGFRIVTNRGRSEGPPKGAHSTARPSGPATEVKVPHS